MGTHKVYTIANMGLHGCQVEVEVDESKGLPKIDIIGLPDTAVKESKERIRSSFKHSGFSLPPRRLIINLAPSHVRKVGTRFDLPIAAGLLYKLLDRTVSTLDDAYFFGELGLDGEVKEVVGLLPSIVSAYRSGVKKFVIPFGNLKEVSAIDDITIYPIKNFRELIEHLKGIYSLSSVQGSSVGVINNTIINRSEFNAIKGQYIAKRALSIAAAGMHNILLVGPPGSGKSLLAKSLIGLLPPIDFKSILEVSQIYSLAGLLNSEKPLVARRPFRSVHHTASKVSIVGGGQFLSPGEVSLAHKGVLFFDELPEFPSQVLEVLRQPLEDNTVTISRVQGTVVYPADIMFVAAMNPCKCGFYKDQDKQCICSLHDIQRYQQKVSGPLLDRFDMIIEVPREKISTILSDSSEDNQQKIFDSIDLARVNQKKRFSDGSLYLNNQIRPKDFSRYILLTDEARDFIYSYAEQYAISGRVVHKLCKVARTIADMDSSEKIEKTHIAEAVYFRGKTLFIGS